MAKTVKLKKFIRRVLLLALVMVVTFGALQYKRPLPVIQPVNSIKASQVSEPIALPWPAYGQAALGAEGFGVLETHGEQKAVPIASVAKVMTAYAVLKQKPLTPGQQGSTITITNDDVLSYNDYYSKNGSVAKVAVDEQISEYQALQALLLPSANNFADTLANWVFGSMDKYIAYANSLAESLGMKDTHIADASGFSPQTTSTSHDLVILGEAALKNPVLAEIVSQQQAVIPEAGTIHNVNWLLGMDSVNGIKTGNTDEAGGCYLFSSARKIAGQDITIIGAVMGAPQLNNAISDSRPLIAASNKGFKTVTAVKAGQSVGYYQTPWNNRTQAVAKQDLSLLVWQNQTISVTSKLDSTKVPKTKDSAVGSVMVKANQKTVSTQAVLSQNIEKPSWRWRIFDR
jgi:D-alanyl-D-alanine carboxypeptidase (penicillin-binding protein 5/6)